MTQLDLANPPAATGSTATPLPARLTQPIVVKYPEPGHGEEDVLTIRQFIGLLKEEEDYFAGEQTRLPLMISRLRKVFFDKWGWRKELISRTADVECRYQVSVIDSHRLISYRDNDRVYANTRTGQSPLICQRDHQEVLLTDGSYCDIAHVLVGLDAFNNPQVVSPLPPPLKFLQKFVPHCDSNMDLVTWLGNLATCAEAFVFDYLRRHKQPLTAPVEQHYVNLNSPGSDMLGDIDGYAISRSYDLSGASGRRLTDILEEYYCSPARGFFAQKRFTLFADAVGLQWDGWHFTNQEEWIRYYGVQLRDATTFMIYSRAGERAKRLLLPLEVWFGGYRDVTKCEELLRRFLETLATLI